MSSAFINNDTNPITIFHDRASAERAAELHRSHSPGYTYNFIERSNGVRVQVLDAKGDAVEWL